MPGTETPVADERLINAAEVGKRLSLSGRTIRNWTRADEFLAPATTRNGRVPRWRSADVNRWIEARGVPIELIKRAAERSAAIHRW